VVHELSLCGAIAEIAVRRADGRQVESVRVRVGQLRQVVPETLEFCWGLVVAGTELDGAELQVDQVPARLECRACSREFAMADQFSLVCPHCKSFDVVVLAGEECDVVCLDLVAS
jgi:hydrogenase nickel incorporation protein HypA/HybF